MTGPSGDGPGGARGSSQRGPARPQPGDGLSPGQAAEIHEALDAERAETLARITALRHEFDGIVDSTALVATDDEHDPEGATIAFERAQLAALLEAAQDHLGDLDEALARLREGRYGTCENCGRPIGAGRLAARPAARTCIACASRQR
ncbi:MAG: TraR/DksA family transcriptional regulator [Streptosporangiales bacterium]